MKAPERPTIKVAILAFETFATIPITGPMDILNESCELQRRVLGEDANRAAFEVELVSLARKPLLFGDAVTLRPHASVSTARRPDLILIPSLGPKVMESLDSLRAFLPWITECSARGARAVSVCTGGFLLAESGLLDGREATTHWFFADLFRQRYPKVELRPERLIVDEGSVITAGAATSFLDLTLYLIELYCGHDAAVLTAKVMLIDMGRRTQLPYTILSTRKMHNDRQILRAQHFLESNSSVDHTIENLAVRVGMSVRNFDRRFRTVVGETPSNYLRRLRIEKAKRLLETSDDTIEEVMVTVGYKDVRSFRRLFHAFTDLSPRAYRQRYGGRESQATKVVPARQRPTSHW
jgi:transcriptional regulator GlxA family with amidase domain